MYILTVLDDFSAAHRLPLSGGRCENLHGHNWKVEIEVRAEQLDESGMVIDFNDLKTIVRDVVQDLDHTFLNEHIGFQAQQPTAENIAAYIYQQLEALLPSERVTLQSIRVWESETSAASYCK